MEVLFGVLVAASFLGDKLFIRQGIGAGLALGGAILIVGGSRRANDMRYVFMVIGGHFAWPLGQTMIKMMGLLSVAVMTLDFKQPKPQKTQT